MELTNVSNMLQKKLNTNRLVLQRRQSLLFVPLKNDNRTTSSSIQSLFLLLRIYSCCFYYLIIILLCCCCTTNDAIAINIQKVARASSAAFISWRRVNILPQSRINQQKQTQRITSLSSSSTTSSYKNETNVQYKQNDSPNTNNDISFIQGLTTMSDSSNNNIISTSSTTSCSTTISQNMMNQENLDDDDYKIRFAGIGQLYGRKLLLSQQQQQKERKSTDDTNKKNIDDTTIGMMNHNDIVLQRLRQSTICVIGIGGVGSWCAESLARCCIGHIILIDIDDICISNINRQIHTTTDTIGKFKIDIMKQRIYSINPSCTVTTIYDFISSNNVDTIFQTLLQQLEQQQNRNDYDNTSSSLPLITGVIDAIDNNYDKAAIINKCVQYDIPIVTIGGSAGYTDPTKILSNHDMVDVNDDKLLRSTRKILRKQYHYPAGQTFMDRKKHDTTNKWNIYCIYSTEINTNNDNIISSSKEDGNNYRTSSSFRTCDSGLGTACYVTGTMGLIASHIMVEGIALNKLIPPDTNNIINQI